MLILYLKIKSIVIAAMFNRRSYGTDITENISIFNWKRISLEKTLLDMSNSLKQITNKCIHNKVFTEVLSISANS